MHLAAGGTTTDIQAFRPVWGQPDEPRKPTMSFAQGIRLLAAMGA